LAQTQAEAQLYEQQHPVQLNTNKFIDKDWVIVVVPQSDDASRSKRHVLQKHPNFPVGKIIRNARPCEKDGESCCMGCNSCRDGLLSTL